MINKTLRDTSDAASTTETQHHICLCTLNPPLKHVIPQINIWLNPNTLKGVPIQYYMTETLKAALNSLYFNVNVYNLKYIH